MKNLFDVLDATLANHKQYCGPRYTEWEDFIVKPALEALGYERVTFHTGESDDFGPLSRVVRCYKGGVCHEFVYG